MRNKGYPYSSRLSNICVSPVAQSHANNLQGTTRGTRAELSNSFAAYGNEPAIIMAGFVSLESRLFNTNVPELSMPGQPLVLDGQKWTFPGRFWGGYR